MFYYQLTNWSFPLFISMQDLCKNCIVHAEDLFNVTMSIVHIGFSLKYLKHFVFRDPE